MVELLTVVKAEFTQFIDRIVAWRKRKLVMVEFTRNPGEYVLSIVEKVIILHKTIDTTNVHHHYLRTDHFGVHRRNTAPSGSNSWAREIRFRHGMINFYNKKDNQYELFFQMPMIDQDTDAKNITRYLVYLHKD